MREKSQIDDMRAALRGDLERARARREADSPQPSVPQPRDTTAGEAARAESSDRLKPVTAGTAAEPSPNDPVETLEPEPAPGPDLLPEPDPEPARPPDPAPSPEPPAPDPEPAPTPAASRPGLLARLFGRG
jgi:hypothetical protein